jgi:rhomboid-like protein
MLCILRCQALKRPLRWSAKPLAHWQSIRPLSQSSTLSLRPTLCFRQEEPAPSLKEKVGPVEYGDSFYEKVGRPHIRNQVLVSPVTLLFPLQLCISEQRSRKFVVFGSCLAISIAAYKTSSETEYWKKKMVALSSVWNLKAITNTDLKRAQHSELIQVSNEKLLFFQCCSKAIYKFCIRILERN